MINFHKPIYLPTVRLHRFLYYLVGASILQLSHLLPQAVYLVCLQISFCFVLMAVYQLWEWSRLTAYEEYAIAYDCFLYKKNGNEIRLSFSEIEVTFLYYSTLDKMKGSTTLGVRLKNGRVFRFCGITQVEKLLDQIKL